MILGLNTSALKAEILLLKDGKQLAAKRWSAGHDLSEQLLPEITKLIKSRSADWSEFKGIVIFEGPGSFTGLRIGFTTANTIAYSLGIPIAAAGGKNWPVKAAKQLKSKKPGQFEFPEYGAPARITLPKAK